MDAYEVDIVDILAYASDELLKSFSKSTDDINRTKIIENYLTKQRKNNVDDIGDFQNDLDWFNVAKPLHLSDLKGCLVILDFFTYCCINCIHILPDLKSLENSFPPESGLVVIGVHSAKFDNEKSSVNLLSAIHRYQITHPVVNDVNSKMWATLGIKCWPTLLIISPSGSPVLILMGEGNGFFLKHFVKSCISFYGEKGELKSYTFQNNQSNSITRASNLSFPTKICCRVLTKSTNEMIAISDSGNNRILLINNNGHVQEKVGGNGAGFVNGNFSIAKFNSPQGVSFLNDDILIVADTGNHSVRSINVQTKEVKTIAGNGMQGTDKVGGLVGSEQSLSSPWDIVVYKTKDMDMSFHLDENAVTEKDVILVAMAGMHQIWAIFLDGIIWWKFKKYEPLTCAAIIGNGFEENRNNSYPQNAAFAQPSGLALNKDTLFIADSESSCIRKVTMIDGKVTAVVGGDRNPLNLFAYGDCDGKQFNAKLQHPMGVCYNHFDDYVYVADTYNNKIKRIDTKLNTIETCPIRENKNLGLTKFNEPDGICCDSSGKFLYIADTNNHIIRVVDIKNMTTWPLDLNFSTNIDNQKDGDYIETLHTAIKITPKSKLTLKMNLSLRNGIKLTEKAPQKWNLCLPKRGIYAEKLTGCIQNSSMIILDINCDDTVEDMFLYCNINVCNDFICMPKKFRTKIKFIQDSESEIKSMETNLNFVIGMENVYLIN